MPPFDDGPTTEQLVAAHATSERLSLQGSLGCLGGVLAVMALGAGFEPRWAYAAGGIVSLAVAITLVTAGSRALSRATPCPSAWLAELHQRHPDARLLVVLHTRITNGPQPWIALVWLSGSETVSLDIRWLPSSRRHAQPATPAGRVQLEVPASELPLAFLGGELDGLIASPVWKFDAWVGGERAPRGKTQPDHPTEGKGWRQLAAHLENRARSGYAELETKATRTPPT